MSSNMEIAIEFANKVRAELRHLTSEEIVDLTDGLEADIASSLDDGVDIGSAKKYASDLLSAAGLSKNEEHRSKTFDSLIKNVVRLSKSISDLAPAWWVFRAWVATQLIGYALFREETGSPAFYEWNNRPFIGFVLLVVLIVVSVQVGRMTVQKLKPLILLSHVALAIGAICIMFWSPRDHNWFVYSTDGPYPTTTTEANFNNCPIVKVPDVVNMRVVDAQFMLDKVNLGYYFFDENMGRRANVDPDEIVISQTPTHVDYLCFGYDVQLTVQKPEIVATTTMPNETTPTKP
jgi:hypothetical protein